MYSFVFISLYLAQTVQNLDSAIHSNQALQLYLANQLWYTCILDRDFIKWVAAALSTFSTTEAWLWKNNNIFLYPVLKMQFNINFCWYSFNQEFSNIIRRAFATRLFPPEVVDKLGILIFFLWVKLVA